MPAVHACEVSAAEVADMTAAEMTTAHGAVPGFGKSNMRFLNAGLRRTNKFAYHAMAIDEHRKAFAPTLWTIDTKVGHKIENPREVSEVEQRWFVGAHANVGGGYASDLLTQAPLKWMMDKAIDHGLAFRKEVSVDAAPAPCAIADSYSEFMHGLYKALTLGRRFYRPVGADPAEIRDSVRTAINETIDASVFERWRLDADYRPPALANWFARRKCNATELTSSVRADDPKIIVE